MENVEEQILSYPHLSAEKQREIETYVEDHPEWASLLQDVRSIESLVSGEDGAVSSDDALLNTYVVVQHLHPEAVPTGLREAFRRFEQRLEADPSLQEQVEAVRDRLEAAEATIDPVAKFEELTGHALEPDAEEASASAPTEPASEPVSNRDTTGSLTAVLDELLRLPLAVRGVGAAVAFLLGAYTVLFAASEMTQTTLDRLAAVDVSNQVVDNYTSTATRSAAPASPDTLTADQIYVDALTAVREARTSTFGLFPTYDPETLDRAERLLTQVLDRTGSGSFLALEARFYLGKVRLAQGQVEEARSHFQAVVEREGRMAGEAQNILETLKAEYPAGESGTAP